MPAVPLTQNVSSNTNKGIWIPLSHLKEAFFWGMIHSASNTFSELFSFSSSFFLFYLQMLFIWRLPNLQMQISQIILKRWGYRIECRLSWECLWFNELQCWGTVVAPKISWFLKPIEAIYPSRKRPAAPTGFSLPGRSIQ